MQLGWDEVILYRKDRQAVGAQRRCPNEAAFRRRGRDQTFSQSFDHSLAGYQSYDY